MIINSTNLNEIRKQVQKIKKQSPKELVIVKAQDIDFNSKILEQKDIDILLSPESHNRKDKFKERDSGLNEYLCRLAKKNNIKIAIDLDAMSILEKKDKARVLARIMQNIELCKRTKTDIILFPKEKYQKLDVLSFFKSLKGSTDQAFTK